MNNKKIEYNLRLLTNLALKQPKMKIVSSLKWYPRMNAKIVDSCFGLIGHEHGAGIVSALSPGTQWDQNIKAFEHVLKNIESGIVNPIELGRNQDNNKWLSRFGRGVCSKAGRIALDGINFEDWNIELYFQFKKAPKTYSFTQCLLLNPDYFVIDLWQVRACDYARQGNEAISIKEYLQLTEIHLKIAREFNLKGFEFQALIWCYIRENFEALKSQLKSGGMK